MSWQLASLLLLVVALGIGFGWYERERPSARVLALVAALAALAVVGRLAFAAFPNVKPTTDIVLFAGYALGAAPGFAVGAVTAVASNVFLSQGPWTVWQMAGWGAVGVGGALLARFVRGRELSRWALAAVCGLAGLAFGAWMDVYQWTLAANQDLASYVAVSVTSLPYNIAHALGNIAFCLVIGPAFVRALRRYRRRFEVRWKPLAAGGAALVVLLAAGYAAAPQAEAASASKKAARYLLRAQNKDGGFGPARGTRSNQLHTGWAALGLASARLNPRDVRRRGGRSIVSFLRRHQGGLRDLGELERTILVLRAAGRSPRSFAGRDLVFELGRRRRRSGSFAGQVSYTAFGIMALRAARQRVPRSSVRWLARIQNDDGGFGLGPDIGSDSDLTGAALEGLAAGRRRNGRTVRRAVAYLRGVQNGDGGFPMREGGRSNAQSTAYAVQGLVAVRAARGSVRRALAYLKGLQRRDGSIRFSSSSAQTPVWVTAQALMALRRKPLPLGRAPRARSRRASAAAAAGGGSTAAVAGRDRRSGGGGGTAEAGETAEPSATASAERAQQAAEAALSKVDLGQRTAAAGDGPAATVSSVPAWLVALAVAATLAALLGVRRSLRARLTPG